MTDVANILVVDDRQDKQVVFRAVLEDLGQNIVVAMSGEEALKQVLKHDFAVILLDVNMPGMDGLQTAALIRGRKRSAHIPIIFITADYGDEVRTARGYSLGAVDFIVSPVVPEILRAKVKVFVDLFLLAEQAKRRAEERITLAEERSARTAAERANERSAFLARASAALSGSLNYGATVHELARLAVPYLADVAAITLPEEGGIPARTDLAWSGPSRDMPLQMESVPAVECYWWRTALGRVMASGKGESFIESAETQEEILEVPQGSSIASLVLLPLVARGRTVGVLSLGLRPSPRTFDPELLSIAADLAGRAAIALDNAFLFNEMRDQDRRKTEFLAMLSHELRNPLAPITNAVHVLQTEAGDKGKLEWATEILERQVNQMRRLVDDLLDVSRITHGKIELKLEAVDVGEVITVAVEAARPFIDGREHALTVRLLSRPIRVKGDFARLAQVLANLLNNAAKYTEKKGRIVVEANEEEGQAVVRVRDSGIGIPAESQATIFELFRQLGHAPDRPEGGLGVGLTLVKRLVEMHGGTIEAHSEGHGKGSEFALRLPLLSEAEKHLGLRARAPARTGEAPVRKRRRILVADDNVDLAASMGLLLEMMGNDVRVTHDGSAAVNVETEFRPDVVFLDIGMTKMNGFDACTRIRGKPWGKEPVIVALTGWGQPEDKRRSREAGFDHHLVKPIEPAALERFLMDIES